MRALLIFAALAATLADTGSTTAAAQDLSFREMRWRDIGPTRAGRARAVAGVASQPNTFYAGFDNGGVWRSTDFGANWVPLFDDQSTGSIGAIAVAPSNPNIIYVGTGAGIIRPDLAIGDGIYKSTDAGRTWQHLGLRDSQMIAAIAVDPGNADRLFVAVLGHPYGPNPERGVFRSTDGGRTFEKVLFKDDYTSANEVLLDPRNPNVLYATLWSQQQSFIEGQGFGNAGMGIFKSTDGGTTWTQLAEGLPAILQANIAIAPSDPNILYATIAPGQGPIGFYKSTDGGAHWFQAIRGPGAPVRDLAQDMRPLARIGGGDLPTVTIDPKDPQRRLHRVDRDVADARRRPHVERRARRAWRRRLPAHLDQSERHADHRRRRRSGSGGVRESWPQLEQLVQPEHRGDVPRHHRQRVSRIASARDSRIRAAPACRADPMTGASRSTTGIRSTSRNTAWPRRIRRIRKSCTAASGRMCRATTGAPAQTTQVGPDTSGTLPGGGAMNRNVRTMPLHFSPIDGRRCTTRRTSCGRASTTAIRGRGSRRT